MMTHVFSTFNAEAREKELFTSLQRELSFLTDEELMRFVIVKKTKAECLEDAPRLRETILKYTPQSIRLDDVIDVLATRVLWAWQGARAKDGSSILLCNGQCLRPSETSLRVFLRALFFVVESLYKLDPEGLTRQGLTLVVDMRNFALYTNGDRHFFQSVAEVLERGWPIKVKQVLLFHVSASVRGALGVFRQLFKGEKIKQRVRVTHYADLKKDIDEHMIPLEYGGKLCDVTFEKWIAQVSGGMVDEIEVGDRGRGNDEEMVDEEEKKLYEMAQATKRIVAS